MSKLDEGLDEILHDFLWVETISIDKARQAIKEAVCEERGCVPEAIEGNEADGPCIYCGGQP